MIEILVLMVLDKSMPDSFLGRTESHYTKYQRSNFQMQLLKEEITYWVINNLVNIRFY